MFRSAICRLQPFRTTRTLPCSPLWSQSTNRLVAIRLETRSFFSYSKNQTATANIPGGRSFFTSPKNRTSTATANTSVPDANLIYDAPLTTTFNRLKIFSLSSLTLSCSFAPLIFIVQSQLPFFSRTCLGFMAVSTSGLSTVMIGTCIYNDS